MALHADVQSHPERGRMKDYDQSLSVLILTSSLPGGHSRNRGAEYYGLPLHAERNRQKAKDLEKRKVPQNYDKETVDIFYSQES